MLGTVHASDVTGSTDLSRSCTAPATVAPLAFLESQTELARPASGKETGKMIRSQLLTVAMTSMCLVACGSVRDPGTGGGPDGGNPLATIDVQGRVVGPTGAALSGLTVRIGQKSAVSGAEGRFSIAGVVPPYDLNVTSGGTSPFVGRYEGLTRADPAITF